MLETLQTLSGSTHLSYRDNKSVTLDARRQFNQADSKVTISTSVHEMPVISKSQMLTVPRSNLMVFGKGHPIWDRNQTVMPYAYALQKDELRDFENNVTYSLNTVPTTASTMEFNVIQNQPDFMRMVAKRIRQAKLAREMRERYKQAYGTSGQPLTEYQMSRIRPEVLARQIMQGINEQLYQDDHKEMNRLAHPQTKAEQVAQQKTQLAFMAMENNDGGTNQLADKMETTAKPNDELLAAEAKADANKAEYTAKRYGGKTISREAMQAGDTVNNLAEAYLASIDAIREFGAVQGFNITSQGSLMYGSQVFVKSLANDVQELLNAKQALIMPTSGSTNQVDPATLVEIQPAFINWIQAQDNLDDFVGGEFDEKWGEAFARRENMDLARDA